MVPSAPRPGTCPSRRLEEHVEPHFGAFALQPRRPKAGKCPLKRPLAHTSSARRALRQPLDKRSGGHDDGAGPGTRGPPVRTRSGARSSSAPRSRGSRPGPAPPRQTSRSRPLDEADALHAGGGAQPEGLPVLGPIGRGVDRAHVRVRGEGRDQLPAEAGQQVDDAPRAGRSSPASRRGGWPGRDLLGGERDDRVAARDDGRDHREEAEERRAVRGDDARRPHRLGDREVEMRRGDGVHGAQQLLVLVGPAGVVDQAVDAAACPSRRRPRGRRSRRASRPARRCAPRASRPGGRGSARGCRVRFAQPGPALAAASTALRRSLRVHCGMLAKKAPGGVAHLEGAGALRADEGAADVDLGGLRDGQAAHPSGFGRS
jgi:hypothetical protein